MKKILLLLPLLLIGCSIKESPVTPDPPQEEPPVIVDPEPDEDIDTDADYRIFFIGNSFTKDAVEHLPGILQAAGLDRILLVHMYFGGRMVYEYNDGWDTVSDYTCYICNPGMDSWKEVEGEKTLAHVASCAKWDVVTIQEHTGRKVAWGWTKKEKADLHGLMDKVRSSQKAIGAHPKLYYILSQAYQDLTKSKDYDKAPFETTDEMWTCLADHAKTAMSQCDFDGIISTGAMLQNLRTSPYNNSTGLTRDGYHLDYGLSSYGASCTVFETIIGPQNGNLTMTGNGYRYNKATPVTDESAPVAQQAARAAIERPYEVTAFD